MAAPDYLTWNGDPGNAIVPRRPGLDDVGGASLEDDQAFPPDPTTMPYAAQLNQWARQIVGLATVAACAVLDVRFSAGTPSVFSVLAPGTSVVTGSFTVVDNGVGDTTISWAADLLPANALPMACVITSDTAIDRVRAVRGTNSVRVKTALGGTGTDADFRLTLG